jgi:hypothetical protein
LPLENGNINDMQKAIPISPAVEENLIKSLADAENIRKKIRLNYYVIGTVLFLGFLFEAITWMSVAIVIIFIFVLVYTKWFGIPVKTFETAYLQQVIKNTLSAININLQIDYARHLKLSELTACNYFFEFPDYFSGKNLIYGDISGRQARISEIYATWIPKESKQFPVVKSVFNGFVLVSEQENEITYPLFITTDYSRVSAALSADANLKSGKLNEGVFYYSGEQLDAIPAQIIKLATAIFDYTNMNGKHIVGALFPTRTSISIINTPAHHYLKPSINKSVYNNEPIKWYYSDLAFLHSCISK